MNKNFEPKKKLILQKIVEIAKESGSPPGVQAFATQTGIKKHEWEGKIWARWSDALIESGLKPNLIGVALDKEILISSFAILVLKLKKIPSPSDMKIEKSSNSNFPSPSTFTAHFKSQSILMEAVKQWIKEKPEFEEIINLVSRFEPKTNLEIQPLSKHTHDISIGLLSNIYIPPIIACLPRLAIAEKEIVNQCHQNGLDENVEFEKRIHIAFQLLGLKVKGLGQGSGRVADGIATCHQGFWAIIYDAKVRTMGFKMGTEDRKFKEYVELHSTEIFKSGITKIYFAVISSHFSQTDIAKAKELTRTTKAKSFVFLEAGALVKIVENKIKNMNDFGFDNIERLLMETKIITENDVVSVSNFGMAK